MDFHGYQFDQAEKRPVKVWELFCGNGSGHGKEITVAILSKGSFK